MARRPNVKSGVKVKTVRPRLTKTQSKAVADKYYGSEPIDISSKGYTDVLNWYNYMHEQDQARDWFLEYVKRNKPKDDLAAARRLPKHMVPTTVGWISRILMNGNKLENLDYFNSRMASLIEAGRKIKEVVEGVKTEVPTISIQDRIKAKIQQLITDCEEAIDNDSTLNIYDWLMGREASPQAAAAVREYYARWQGDFEEDEFDTKDVKQNRAKQKKYWETFVSDCDRYCGNKKAVKIRKPREKKTKSAVDLVKNLQYQKDFPQLKIVSVNPAEIIGATQVWTYNTKYRKLTRLDASGPSGIQVKGTTLIGFDVERSLTKRLRKPDITIQSLLGAGKINLRRLMDDIKSTEAKAAGRINTDTVILRVIK